MNFLFNLLGGPSGQIYIYLALVLGGFGAGFYVEHLRFSEYKNAVEIAAQKQEAEVESIKKQHQLVTKGIQDEYDAKLNLVRQYYANGVRNPNGSSTVPGLSTTAKIADVAAAYNLLAGQCAETTVQLIELQKWINEQIGIK